MIGIHNLLENINIATSSYSKFLGAIVIFIATIYMHKNVMLLSHDLMLPKGT